ncbi:MAG: hypothetical protein KG012_20450 [Deltaproteobacteria bacterium]|nr:hypothetical protein [Deltaproteobacteria bacterium]
MLSYYEKLLNYWRKGNITDALKYFDKCKEEGLLAQEEIEKLEKIIPDKWEQLEGELEDNPKVIFNFYEALKKSTNWNDNTMCKKLRISMADIMNIQNLKKPRYKKVGTQIVLELIRGVSKN